jgi:hypothetical protein
MRRFALTAASSLLLHGGIVAGLSIGAIRNEVPGASTLAGETFELQDRTEVGLEASEMPQAQASDPSAESTLPYTELTEDDGDAPAPRDHRKRHGEKPDRAQKKVEGHAAQTGIRKRDNGSPSAAGGAASGGGSYGAVGNKTALDLSHAFVRMFPQATGADPIWVNAALGKHGAATVTLSLSEEGRITAHSVTGGSDELKRGIASTLTMMKSRLFTAKGATTSLTIAATVSADTVHDGLHGDVHAIHAAMNGSTGIAFFALPIGRRVDVTVHVR